MLRSGNHVPGQTSLPRGSAPGCPLRSGPATPDHDCHNGGQFLPPDASYSRSSGGERRHLHAVRDAQNKLLLRPLTVVNNQSHQGKAESRPTHAVWLPAITVPLRPNRYHWVPLLLRPFRQKPQLRSHQIPHLHLNHELSAYSDS